MENKQINNEEYKIIEYFGFENESKEYENNYYKLLEKYYKITNNKNYNSYIESIKKLRTSNNPSINEISIKTIQIYDTKNKLQAHCSLIIDKRNKDTGIFGFYECENNKQISKLLINTVTNYFKSKNCNKITGPINITIWNNYRLCIDYKQEDSFEFEPINQNYYIEQLNELFKKKEYYYSAKRTNFDNIINLTKKAHDKTLENGFYFKTLSKENYLEFFKYFYHLSNEIFKESPEFVKLTIDEYKYIYSRTNQTTQNFDFIQLLFTKENEPIGFCFSIIDKNDKTKLIFKTLGILKQYQKFGLGTGFLYLQHKLAKEKNMTQITYALIRYENNIRKMIDVDATLLREYVLYKKNIE